MPALWGTLMSTIRHAEFSPNHILTPGMVGIPPVSQRFMLRPKKKKPKAIGYIKGLSTKLPVDYYLIRAEKYDIEAYLKDGGDPKKIICNWLAETEKVEMMWSDKPYRRWVERLKGWGVSKVISPDISTWYEWPMPVIIHNIYRSSVLTTSLGESGFKIVPNIRCTNPNHITTLQQAWWPESKIILVDSHTIRKADFNLRGWKQGSKQVFNRFPNSYFWIWAGTEYYPRWWAQNITTNCYWVLSRSCLRRKVYDDAKVSRRKNVSR